MQLVRIIVNSLVVLDDLLVLYFQVELSNAIDVIRFDSGDV